MIQIRTATRTISENPLRICVFLFLSYTFGIETINTFLVALPQFPRKPYPVPDQNIRAKSIPIFRPKRLKNPTLWSGSYLPYMAYIRVYLPLPPLRVVSHLSSVSESCFGSSGDSFSSQGLSESKLGLDNPGSVGNLNSGIKASKTNLMISFCLPFDNWML